MPNNQITKEYWSSTTKELLDYHKVNDRTGLTEHEVIERRKKYGTNTLRLKPKIKSLEILVRQLKSTIVALLFIAILISLFLKQNIEAISISLVLLANTLIGFFTEFKAIRSMESLRSISETTTKTLRDRSFLNINASELVPGDIVLLEGGDLVTADIRLLEAAGLMCDESTFTGESLAAQKNTGDLNESSSILERTNTLFKGTSVLRGSATGIVIQTGIQTELGKIAKLTIEAKAELTPLEKRLENLGKKLIYVTLILTIFIIFSGVLSGHKIFLMLQVAIALAIAAIPEGLPIVATIALAKGMLKMAKKNALINKLSAVETLGAITVIFTDKTGTLTENKMQVSKYQFSFGEVVIQENEMLNKEQYSVLEKALQIGSLCTNAKLNSSDDEKHVGDTLEVALLQTAKYFGIEKEKLLLDYPELREEAFDFELRRMATVHKVDGQYFYAVKGAPESILEISNKVLTLSGFEDLNDESYKNWLSYNEKLASEGGRILALAYKTSEIPNEDVYSELIFVGLVCLRDPPRKDIGNSMALCKEAGILPIMVTGDQLGTAFSIAKEIGLLDEDQKEAIVEGKDLLGLEDIKKILRARVFCRVTPKQKLDLISIFQSQKNIVAMTGDGVNDAPALKKADIGIAMGLRGTQVAKEAADMVLKDDSFSTIIQAIYQGRVIFNNIRLFVIYLLSCNLSEILIVATATIINLPLPLLPLQILFLNLVTDVFPALALGMGEGDESYAHVAPRDPSAPIIGTKTWGVIFAYGILITLSVLTVFLLSHFYYSFNAIEAVTVSFLTLGFAQILHVFNMRSAKSKFLINEITKNLHVWGAIVLCFILLLSVVYFAPLRDVLELVIPSKKQWLLICIFSCLPLVCIQVYKEIFFKIKKYNRN